MILVPIAWRPSRSNSPMNLFLLYNPFKGKESPKKSNFYASKILRCVSQHRDGQRAALASAEFSRILKIVFTLFFNSAESDFALCLPAQSLARSALHVKHSKESFILSIQLKYLRENEMISKTFFSLLIRAQSLCEFDLWKKKFLKNFMRRDFFDILLFHIIWYIKPTYCRSLINTVRQFCE